MTRTLDYTSGTSGRSIRGKDVGPNLFLAILWPIAIPQDPKKHYILLIVLYLQNIVLFKKLETQV